MEAAAAESRARRKAIASVASRLQGWRPQAEVVREVVSIPTVFESYNLETEIGGHPTARTTLVHGPASNGKTQFALGIAASYLQADHFAAVLDAERTLTQSFVRSMVGPLADHPGFSALPVGTYEQARVEVRRYFETIAQAREKREIPEDVRALVVVDSLRKLMPAGLWETLTKEAKVAAEESSTEEQPKKRKSRFVREKKQRHVDGFGGRAGQLRAAFNAAWMDELTPLLADTGGAVLIIGRESVEEEGQGPAAREVARPTGGSALIFEASLRLRCVASNVVEEGGEKGRVVEVGQRVSLEFHKTKVARRREFLPTAFFHVSNGRACPEGFDFARDLFWVGQELGLVEVRGSFYRFDGKQIGQGEKAAHRKLVEDAKLMAALRSAIRAEDANRRALRAKDLGDRSDASLNP